MVTIAVGPSFSVLTLQKLGRTRTLEGWIFLCNSAFSYSSWRLPNHPPIFACESEECWERSNGWKSQISSAWGLYLYFAQQQIQVHGTRPGSRKFVMPRSSAHVTEPKIIHTRTHVNKLQWEIGQFARAYKEQGMSEQQSSVAILQHMILSHIFHLTFSHHTFLYLATIILQLFRFSVRPTCIITETKLRLKVQP